MQRFIQLVKWDEARTKFFRLFLRTLLMVPFAKVLTDFVEDRKEISLNYPFRFNQSMNTGRNPGTPPMPLAYIKDWENVQQMFIRNKVSVDSIIEQNSQALQITEADFPIRENPDMVDYIYAYSMYNREKQSIYLETARKMEQNGDPIPNVNMLIRSLEEYKYEDLQSIIIPKL